MSRGLGLALLGFAKAITPAERIGLSAWAEAHREVSAEAGSPNPGRWRNDIHPFLVEIMDLLSSEPPPEKVVVRGSAQVAKTEIALNWFAWTVDVDPMPLLWLVPTIEEGRKLNRLKLQPTIDATPRLRGKILDVVSRDAVGSTTTFKRFRGGFAVITGANSSKGLQMFSAPRRVYDEVSEYPPDVGGRGEPTSQADKRALAWTARGSTALYLSTPRLKGSCRITEELEAGDCRHLYAPCPACGDYQRLAWEQMRWKSEHPPHGAFMVCRNGCVIDADRQGWLIDEARFIKTFDGGAENPAPPESFPAHELERWRNRPSGLRHPSFAIWQAMSRFVPWEHTVTAYFEALRAGPTAMKAFVQQNLGEPWEESGDAPKSEMLLSRREDWPARRIPPGVLLLTGSTDVQGNRLEWAVWGWDRRLGGYLIDRGILEGDPNSDDVWHAHDDVMARTWQDAWGRTWPVSRWAIDAGYLSPRVYGYVRRHGASGKVLALDGRSGWGLPALGTARKVKFQVAGRKLAVMLYPVGTFNLKSEVYSRLGGTEQGPDEAGVWPAGCLRFPMSCDLGFFEQLTAEYVVERRTRTGQVVREWARKARQPNEQLDLAVYALALAHRESDGLTVAQWDELAAARIGPPEEVQSDLSALWSEETRAVVQAPRLQPIPAPGVRRSQSRRMVGSFEL